jgi:hypothetical protein
MTDDERAKIIEAVPYASYYCFDRVLAVRRAVEAKRRHFSKLGDSNCADWMTYRTMAGVYDLVAAWLDGEDDPRKELE